MVLLRSHEGRWNAFRAAARAGLTLLVATAFQSGQTVAAEASSHAQGTKAYAQAPPPRPAGPPLVIQVQPAAKEVEAEAERQSAERKVFGLQPDEWVALFNLILGASTILLWLETRRLAAGAEEQHKTLQASVRTAEKAAEAAKASADSFRKIERGNMGFSIDLVKLENGWNYLQFTFVNTGRSVIFIASWDIVPYEGRNWADGSEPVPPDFAGTAKGVSRAIMSQQSFPAFKLQVGDDEIPIIFGGVIWRDALDEFHLFKLHHRCVSGELYSIGDPDFGLWYAKVDRLSAEFAAEEKHGKKRA